MQQVARQTAGPARATPCSGASARPAARSHQVLFTRMPLRHMLCQASNSSNAGNEPDSSSSQPKPLSPASITPGASGITVKGFSPTSLQGWAIVKSTLRDNNVKLLSAQEVVFAQERGVPIIDVRPYEQYEKGHIPGAVNVPFFQPIEGWDPVKMARRVGFAMFGVFNGTEVNPNFAQEAEALVDPQLGAVIYCSIGGTLDPAEGSKKGLQSRSLIATWQLVNNGVKNLSVLKGGYSEWFNSGRDIAELVDADQA